LLQDATIARCLAATTNSASPAEAVDAATHEVVEARADGLAAELACRASVMSFSHEDRALGFSEELFAGASDYLVSRDASGFVGVSQRLRTVEDLSRLKAEIGAAVRARVHDVGPPPGDYDPVSWGDYVRRVTIGLRR